MGDITCPDCLYDPCTDALRTACEAHGGPPRPAAPLPQETPTNPEGAVIFFDDDAEHETIEPVPPTLAPMAPVSAELPTVIFEDEDHG